MNDFADLPLFAGGSGGQPGQHLTAVGQQGLWLVVDPRRAGWAPGQDLGPFLAKAGELFRAKPWSGGAPPSVVRAHPVDAANGTGSAAQLLGLQVIADPKVARGTVWLGLAEVGP